MAHGVHNIYSAPIAANATESAGIDLGRCYDMVWLEVPDMSAACVTATCNVYMQASTDGATYRRIYHPVAATAASGSNVFFLPNSFTSAFIPIPNAFRWVKIEAGNTMTAAAGFRIVCSDMGG